MPKVIIAMVPRFLSWIRSSHAVSASDCHIVATVLASIPAPLKTVESEGGGDPV
jgi:hypothetical protein